MSCNIFCQLPERMIFLLPPCVVADMEKLFYQSPRETKRTDDYRQL